MPRIPKIVHYCFGFAPDFGGKPWSLVHYVSVASAIRHIAPDAIYFYYEFEPEGPWWEITKPLVTPVNIKAPATIHGRPLLHPAHRADVVRLEKLIEHGGIYLDADVIVQRSFDDLLDNSVVLGRERFGRNAGIANAIIVAEPGAAFLKHWLETYRSFRGKGLSEYWNEHSLMVPAELAVQHPDEVTVLPPTAFYWPTSSQSHIEWILNSADSVPLEGAYASHLWESKSWGYLKHLTPGQLRGSSTNFAAWARPYVATLADDFGATLQRKAINYAGNWKRRLRSVKRLIGRRLRRSSPPTNVDRKGVFEEIYKGGQWGSDGSEFYSGVGSRGQPLDEYVENMAALLRKHQEILGRPVTVVDIGCGDFHVGRALIAAAPGISYVGCDIVAPLVMHNQRHFGSDKISFMQLDIVSERPPEGDICLVRQVLQHLSNTEVSCALEHLAGFSSLYVTEGQPEVRFGPPNPDKAVGVDVRFDWQRGVGRGLELGAPPFNARTEEVFRTFAFPHEVIVTDRVSIA